MKQAIFLQPVFKEKIWGGEHLKSQFAYDIPSAHTGEAWVISAHDHGASTVIDGPFAGQSLADLWVKEAALFNKGDNAPDAYPLLVKLLDANDDLSVQVHPDDKYAQAVEGVPYGKTECWYVLDAADDAQIILGHHAKTQAEFDQQIDRGEWDKLLHYQNVKAGDFFYVPSGTIHAIRKGILILEIQQSSDTTYRVYDYDRKDADGNTRELHLEKSKAVTNIPHDFESTAAQMTTASFDDLKELTLIAAKYFTVKHWQLNGQARLENTQDFLQVNVLDGEGTLIIDDAVHSITRGDHFILPYGVKEFTLDGAVELMVSHP